MMKTVTRIVLVYFVVYAQSGSKIIDIRNANVTISSPCFPDEYPADSSVVWKVELPSLTSFTLKVTHLSLEKSEGCKFDSLLIKSSQDASTAGTLLGPSCGKKSHLTNLTASIVSYGFVVVFVSDSSVQYQGFSLEVTGIGFSEHEICESMLDQEEFLLSSNLDLRRDQYPGNVHCNWSLSSAPNKQITLHFDRLDIEFSGDECLYDHIEVWGRNGFDNTSGEKLLARLCGRHPPWTMETFSTEIHILFISDGLDNEGGFLIRYDPDAPADGSPVPVRKTQAELHPQTNAVLGLDIQGSLRFVWKFRTLPGYQIHTEMEKAFIHDVRLHDGPDLTFEKVQVKGNTAFSSAFHLTAMVDLSIFNKLKYSSLTYQSVLNFPWYVPSYVYMQPSESSAILSKMRILEENKYISVFIIVGPKWNIEMKFTSKLFQDSPNIDNCAYAGIAIYNQDMKPENLIGPFCDTNPSYMHILTRSYLSSRNWVVVIVYNYTQGPYNMFEIPTTSFRTSKCKGITLTDRSSVARKYNTHNFWMTANVTRFQLDISIGYNETQNDCLNIQILRYWTRKMKIRLSLSGTFSYRICRRWDIHDPLIQPDTSTVSKYDTTERCNNKTYLENESKKEIIPVPTGRGWSQQYIRISLGSVSLVSCSQYVQYTRDTQCTVQMPCGFVRIIYTCKLVTPFASTEYYWRIKMLNVRRRGDFSLDVVEHHRSLNVTVSSHLPAAFLSSHTFYSMQDTDLFLSKAWHHDIEFQVLKPDILHEMMGTTKSNEDCYILQDHCYTFTCHDQPTSWFQAHDSCLRRGGYLVSINTLKELQLLKRALSSSWLRAFHGNGRGLIYTGLQDAEQVDDYRWVDGSPLTFTDWYYPFGDDILPYHPKPPIDQRLTQPVADKLQRCVAMVPGNLHQSTNWRKVNCFRSEFSSPVYSICEYNNTTPTLHNYSGNGNSVPETLSVEKTCVSPQFTCHGGVCLNPDRACDFHKDCPQGDDEWNCSLSRTDLFRCFDGQNISASSTCDFYSDCLDGSDELYCVHRNCSETEERCNNGQCVSVDVWCDQKEDCIDGSDEDDCDYEQNCKGFKCPRDGCVVPTAVDDMQADCPDKTEADEKKVTKFTPEYCRGGNRRCYPEHHTCYWSAYTCVYDHDIYGKLKYCRNGAHLKHCEEFECPDLFKCPQSYCIPYHKVCDDIQDCVRGEDESHCEDNPCPGKLRCGSTSQCVSQVNVCDGVVNCKRDRSDEKFCDLSNFSCPVNCTCFGYSINCKNNKLQNLFNFYNLTNVRSFHLGQNNISVSSVTLVRFPYLSQLYLPENNVKDLHPGSFRHVPNLLVLDLSDNHIEVLPAFVFQGLKNLRTLKLKGNPIHQITSLSFCGLPSLSRLNLSGMQLSDLGPHSFACLGNLKYLDLSNNVIHNLSAEAFAYLPFLDLLLLENNSLELSNADSLQNLSVRTLMMDSYKFCCFAGVNVDFCFPAVGDSRLCADLFSSDALRVLVGVIGTVSLLGNIFVIFWRLYSKLSDVPSVFVLNLSLSDFLMALYLVGLSIADLYYRGIYVLTDDKWRHSVYCKTIGVLGVISCEMSMYTLVFIAIDRTKKLAYPFRATQFDIPTAWKVEICGWIACILCSILPFILPFYFGDYYSRNDICLPFNFTDTKGEGWEMTTAIFVGLNSIGLVVIIVMYILIFLKVKRTQRKAGRKDHIEIDVARKLSIVILTDMVCLLPLIVTSLRCVLGHPVDRRMAALLASLIFPLNAALNPYLFTISTWEHNPFCKKSKD